MKLSCCAYSFRDMFRSGAMAFDEFPAMCRRIGCDGAELTSYYFPSTERSYLNQVKQRAHHEGICISGTAIGSDFANPDSEKRKQHLDMALEWIEHSVVLGAPTLRLFAGGVRHAEGQTEQQAFDSVVGALKLCGARAYDSGVALALENHGGLTATADGTMKLAKAADSPAVGLNLDFGNFASDCYEQFTVCAPLAVATHAKPYTAGPKAGERNPVDYKRVREIMDAAGYRGWISIEYEEEVAGETEVGQFAAVLRAAFAAGS